MDAAVPADSERRRWPAVGVVGLLLVLVGMLAMPPSVRQPLSLTAMVAGAMIVAGLAVAASGAALGLAALAPRWFHPVSGVGGSLLGVAWGVAATFFAGGDGIFLIALPSLGLAIFALVLHVPRATRRHALGLWLSVALAWLTWHLTADFGRPTVHIL